MTKTINDLKEKLPKKFYDDLLKCDFIKDIIFMINNQALISIDIDDFVTISKSEVIGTISQEIKSFDDDFNIRIISDNKPTDCILNIITKDKDISLNDINSVISKLKKIYPNINIIYGASVNPEAVKSGKLLLQALLTYSR